MEMFNILASDVAISLFGQTFDVSLNWIGNLIRLLITGIGSVGVGIILFSLILKVIVLPFDIYQRIAMRKQNIQMKENQEKMQKLQKQYANDKNMYNQKVMEMYKQNGFSMFSSCLPMILSLVIFFVAINAFNAYSQYSNVENYNTMVRAYNAKMEEFCVDLDDTDTSFTLETITSTTGEGEEQTTVTVHYLMVKNSTDDIYYKVQLTDAEKTQLESATDADKKTFAQNATHDKLTYFIKAEAANKPEIAQFIQDKHKAYNEAIEGDACVSTEECTGVYANGVCNVCGLEHSKPFDKDEALEDYFTEQAQAAVVQSYKTEVAPNTKFLWIKNIWATDASYKHPVLPYADFKGEISREKFEVNETEVKFDTINKYTNAYDEYAYNEITGMLDEQKTQANGYFVLIVLSIGTILLQQFVSMRTQKEQQKYSTVDGQGGSQQKMMMIVMTLMFAVFSFMYSSSFSIYMIMSNLFSLVSMLIINKLVDISMAKKERKALQEKYNKRFPGRNANGKGKK